MQSALADIAQVLMLPGTIGSVVGQATGALIDAPRERRQTVRALAGSARLAEVLVMRMREIGSARGSVKPQVSEDTIVRRCPYRRDQCARGRKDIGRLSCDGRRFGRFTPGTQ
ncbi:hypothetical protein [Streptomyces sp. NPDC001480]|uniref:hypothetical protein n=1 Tax=Streptomyces sp. NPDC001480 TaxID=3364577 RepID=UPI0036B85515